MNQPMNNSSSPIPEIGVMLNNLEHDRLKAFAVAAGLGFRHVHASGLPEAWLMDPERALYILAALKSGLAIDTVFVGFDGQSYADLPTIARTVGLTNPETRGHRRDVALAYVDLALELIAPSLSAHLGMLAGYEDEPDLVHTVQVIADGCARGGLSFHLETGQESAQNLRRFLEKVDRPNVGVNFDPANFLLYGTDEPLLALEILAGYVRGIHCKDGFRPEQRGRLGREVPIGQGAVDFPAFVKKLRQIGYTGTLVIEREHGPNVIADILTARDYLQGILMQCAE